MIETNLKNDEEKLSNFSFSHSDKKNKEKNEKINENEFKTHPRIHSAKNETSHFQKAEIQAKLRKTSDQMNFNANARVNFVFI